ncbi:MAG TPA: hypothetical protein VFI84_02035 [Candidatus Saccharimonadales bacterium]|nr:hypothetical protein [Candidatus Saccharimonadales bacterium]
MRKTDIIEQYWEEFLQDCHYELVTHDTGKARERTVAQPTENNFWAWYMKNKMVQQKTRIDEYLAER